MTDRDETPAEQRVSGAPTVSDAQIAAGLVAGGYIGNQCPCGAPRTAMPAFHRSSMVHDCVRHQSFRCGHCRRVERMIAQVEARLKAEANHGPFVVRKDEA